MQKVLFFLIFQTLVGPAFAQSDPSIQSTKDFEKKLQEYTELLNKQRPACDKFAQSVKDGLGGLKPPVEDVKIELIRKAHSLAVQYPGKSPDFRKAYLFVQENAARFPEFNTPFFWKFYNCVPNHQFLNLLILIEGRARKTDKLLSQQAKVELDRFVKDMFQPGAVALEYYFATKLLLSAEIAGLISLPAETKKKIEELSVAAAQVNDFSVMNENNAMFLDLKNLTLQQKVKLNQDLQRRLISTKELAERAKNISY